MTKSGESVHRPTERLMRLIAGVLLPVDRVQIPDHIKLMLNLYLSSTTRLGFPVAGVPRVKHPNIRVPGLDDKDQA